MNKKLRNFWDYYKWYILCGIIAAGILLHLLARMLNIGTVRPDIQLAYTGTLLLSPEEEDSVRAFLLKYADDYNGDGRIEIEIHQYTSGIPDGEAGEAVTDAALDRLAHDVNLVADINDCESYFFLMDDPDAVQIGWHILANADGSCPSDTDFGTEDKVFPFGEGLFLGRRCFYTEKRCRHADELAELWNCLAEDSGLSGS